MADPYLASNDFPGDDVTTLRTISFKGNRPDAGSGTVPYLSASDVKASKITPATPTTPETETPLTVTYVGPNQFNITPACPVGTICRVYRATQDEYNLVDYQALQTVSEADLDLANRQTIFIVQEAHDLAQRAKADVSQATTIAYDAAAEASDATAAAAAATSTANTALSTAQAAVVTANSASTQAGNATTTANNALSVANGVDAKATQALADSATAVSTANAAAATANGIAGTANTALAQANAAVATASNAQTTANGAVATANGVDAKAQQALDDSATALSTANTALSTANGFESRVSALETSQGTQNTDISNLQSTVSTHTTQIGNLSSGKQPLDATLTGLAALTIAANQVPIGNGADSFTTIASGATGRSLLAAANAAAVLALIPTAYHRGNSKGTVSQSGGNPTGAIVEYGANTNGYYVRFLDGTQICALNYTIAEAITNAQGAFFYSAALSWTFPAAFAAVPWVQMTPSAPGNVCWGAEVNAGTTTTGTTFYTVSGISNTPSVTRRHIAIGRWY